MCIRDRHTAAPELELIAEDLGTIDDDVRRLGARAGCPGRRVLLFGFDPSGTSEHRPCLLYTSRCV